MNTSKKTPEQRKGIIKTVIILVAIMAVFFALFLNKLFSPRIMSPEELQINGAIIFDAPRIIKPFELVAHTGETFSNEDLEGKWTLMFFGFTHCPDICPNTLAKLAQVHKQLDSDIQKQTRVVLVSVDPARDTVDKLAEYVPWFHPEFIGVTGEFTDILKFSRNVNVVFNKVKTEDDYTIDHSGNIVLVNPDGHYAGFFKPPFELARLKTTFSSIATTY